jgi:hypothetical protein
MQQRPMSDRVVHTWPKNAHEDVHATLGTYQGHQLASIRVYVVDENEQLRPTKKGISVRVEDLPKLKESVDALVAAVELEAEAA